MKKIVALALSLLMLFGCVSALAETAENTIVMQKAFTLKYDNLPEGYVMYPLRDTDMEYEVDIRSKDPQKPEYNLYMAFNDEWDGVSTLADATELDWQLLKADFYEVQEMDEGDIVFEDALTAAGLPILIAKAVDGSFASVYAIYESHEIELVVRPGIGAEALTEEDISKAVAFAGDAEIVPLKK